MRTELPTLGNFGDLVSTLASLLSSNGLELIVNFGLILVLAAVGYRLGKFLADASLSFGCFAVVAGGYLFVTGAPAGYFVANAGVFYLAFVFPVWEEAYFRVSA